MIPNVNFQFRRTNSAAGANGLPGSDFCGGFYSSDSVAGFSFAFSAAMTGLEIIGASCKQGIALPGGVQFRTSMTLAYTAPGSATEGAQVNVGEGSLTSWNVHVLYDGDDTEDYLVVRVKPMLLPLTDTLAVFTASLANATLFSDTYTSAVTTGLTDYRCIALYNATGGTLAGLTLNLVGASVIAAEVTADYAASGALALEVSHAETLSWPSFGFLYNATTEEHMFYRKLALDGSTDVLHVAAAQRGMRGSTAAAGFIGEMLHPSLPLDVGVQAGASAVSIANLETAPVGVTFTHPERMDGVADAYFDSLALPSIADGGWVAVWLRRVLPATPFASLSGSVGMTASIEVVQT